MARERDTFQLSGPCYLTHVDWSDPGHRRCIAASLVQGVYVQEQERQDRRPKHETHAEMWWSFFSFKLLHPLLDRSDGSIFGAVYKWSKKAAGVRFQPPGVPKIVVALRGTVAKAESVVRDLRLDFNIFTNELHRSCRFHCTLDAVKASVHKHGSESVWIAGHSLGAAMGMLAGRKMAEEEQQFLQTHLFNPPFILPPVERIKNEKIKSGFHIARSLVTAGLSMTLLDSRARAESQKTFSALRLWVPCLYVNRQDYVSSGYVGYFANQQVMHEMGAGGIAELAARHSISEMLLSAFGKKSKAGHLIPCARLIINLSASADFKTAHGIHQWWAADIKIQCTEYRLVPAEHPKTAFHLQAHI
ncbi:hypothetical protein SUGI_0709870 [Cryptomeria japonica]|uniref:GDSL esterase/lipase At4g10955 n=1 Tax=Cryptomeria japonica TaxID=3369 RepID=UPI0024146AC9|nr:GDSL esterase/lipase At4g10955 [Cryptomeria japonica]GLJ35276.1 hypothetical protein SUGI_0709870 [Cryptomeria japonica]